MVKVRQKGEPERDVAECMGGDELCLASPLYLIVLILPSVCNVATHQHFQLALITGRTASNSLIELALSLSLHLPVSARP